MDHIERFFATIQRETVDRPCTWLGIPDGAALPGLFKYFEVADVQSLIEKLDDDIVPVELPYHSPTSDAIYAAFDFAKQGKIKREHRTLNAPGYFEDMNDLSKVDDFPWPDPTLYIDKDECQQVVDTAVPNRVILGVIWSAHFQDACAAFGMENAFMQMIQAPEMFQAVIDRIVDFYLKANEIFFEATKGKLHAVLIGNDFGSQTGLMLSPNMIRQFAFSGTKKLVDQAKSYGLKVIHHSCGSIRDIIPDMIDLGIDAVHPIQALATGMEPAGLKRDFGDRMSFCGGVDAQDLMVCGTADQVQAKVLELRGIFPTGLIISPSHEAILPDTPPSNVEAMFAACRA